MRRLQAALEILLLISWCELPDFTDSSGIWSCVCKILLKFLIVRYVWKTIHPHMYIQVYTSISNGKNWVLATFSIVRLFCLLYQMLKCPHKIDQCRMWHFQDIIHVFSLGRKWGGTVAMPIPCYSSGQISTPESVLCWQHCCWEDSCNRISMFSGKSFLLSHSKSLRPQDPSNQMNTIVYEAISKIIWAIFSC